MHEREIHKAIEVLKTAFQTINEGEAPSGEQDAALGRMSAALSEESLHRIIGPMHLSAETLRADAATYLDTILEAMERAGITVEADASKVRLLLEFGTLLYIRGEWDGAQKRVEQALEICEEISYEAGRANALRQLGRLQRRRGDWEKAATTLEQALEICRALEDKTCEAEVLLNLGNIKFEQGRYEDAEQVYQDALEICEGLDAHLMVGDIALSLGVIRLVLGHEDEAMAHFTESLSRYQITDDRRRIGQACFNQGITYAEQGQWERAGTMYERTLDIARQEGDPALVGLVYLRRGEMQARFSDAAMALGYARQAMEMFEQLDDPLGRADVYRLYSRVAGLKEAWTEAEEFLRESARLNAQYECRLGLAEVEEMWGWLYERRGEREKAIDAYGRAMEQYHGLRAVGSARRVRDASMQLMEEMG